MENHTKDAFDEENEGYIKIDRYNATKTDLISSHYADILNQLGEDPEREGLLKTPERVAKSLQYLTHGYDLKPAEILRSAMFKEDYSQMVVVKDIEVYSMCEHHMLPFFGKAHVAYISSGKVIGLSKLNRIVQHFAKRPQVQERLTMQIADELKRALQTEDVAVIIDAAHLCVSTRGVNDTASSTLTAAYSGKFDEEATRQEFLKYVGMKPTM